MNTSQSRLVRESRLVRDAMMREPARAATGTSGRGGWRPSAWTRVEALADKHGIDRDVARRLAAELHRYAEAT